MIFTDAALKSLRRCETLAHWLCWSLGCLYSTYRLYELLAEHRRHLTAGEPHQSWLPSFLPPADRGDAELEVLFKKPLPLFIVAVCVHLAVTRRLRSAGRQSRCPHANLRPLTHAFVGAVFLWCVVGWQRFALMLAVIVASAPAALGGCRRLVWLIVLTALWCHSALLDAAVSITPSAVRQSLLLLLLGTSTSPSFASASEAKSYDAATHSEQDQLEDAEDASYYLTTVHMWCLCRIVMVGCDRARVCGENSRQCRSDGSGGDSRGSYLSLAGYFGYCLYTPTLLGPLLSPTQYANSLAFTTSSAVSRRRSAGRRLLLRLAQLSAYWLLLLELSSRLLPMFSWRDSMLASRQRLSNGAPPVLSRWQAAGLVYWAGQYFHVKYVLLYGVGQALAAYDGVPRPPAPPRCVAAITSYARMWRYFDCGLYTFLRNYIYVPLVGTAQDANEKGGNTGNDGNETGGTEKHSGQGGNRGERGNNQCGNCGDGRVWRQLAASAVVFAFVYVWHGQTQHMLAWTLANYCCLLAERAGVLVGRTISSQCGRQGACVASWCGGRLVALASAPLFMFSLASQAGFLTDSHTLGVVVLRHCLHPGGCWNLVVTLTFMYCACRVSADVERWRQSRRKSD